MYRDHQQLTLAGFRSTLSAVIAPLQYTVDFPFRFFSLIHSNLSTHQTLLTENTTLKANQLLLRAQLQKLIALESENANLRALLKSLPPMAGKITRMEAGQLLAVNEGSYAQEVIVDKGSQKGVYVGQPVLDEGGVMGQVIAVGPFTSRVLLITDVRSAVPIQSSRNGVRAIAVGQGIAKPLLLIHVPETSEIKVGDQLVTSGLGGNYPEGYPLGSVTQVIKSRGATPIEIHVKPSAQVNHHTQVLFIWPTAKNIFIDVPPESTPLKPHKMKIKPKEVQ